MSEQELNAPTILETLATAIVSALEETVKRLEAENEALRKRLAEVEK